MLGMPTSQVRPRKLPGSAELSSKSSCLEILVLLKKGIIYRDLWAHKPDLVYNRILPGRSFTARVYSKVDDFLPISPPIFTTSPSILISHLLYLLHTSPTSHPLLLPLFLYNLTRRMIHRRLLLTSLPPHWRVRHHPTRQSHFHMTMKPLPRSRNRVIKFFFTCLVHVIIIPVGDFMRLTAELDPVVAAAVAGVVSRWKSLEKGSGDCDGLGYLDDFPQGCFQILRSRSRVRWHCRCGSLRIRFSWASRWKAWLGSR